MKQATTLKIAVFALSREIITNEKGCFLRVCLENSLELFWIASIFMLAHIFLD